MAVVFSNDLKVWGQCEEAYSKASQMLGLIKRIVVLEGSRVMGWWLVLLVNYAVIGNGSNMRWIDLSPSTKNRQHRLIS